MAKIDTTFPWDAYRFLIKPLRDGDKDGVLERYLGGPQADFERIQQDIQKLDTLRDIEGIDDDFLIYLKWLLGWTAELASITDGLAPDVLRKLIRLSAEMWKLKGSPVGIVSSIRALTGRDVLYRDWFWFRWSVGGSGLWWVQRYSDPWLVGWSHGDRDEYLSVLFVMVDLGIPKQLIRDILQLNRPLHESFLIVYADFVDDFHLGRGRWMRITGTDVAWDEDNFRLVLPDTSRQECNVARVAELDEMVYTSVVQFTVDLQVFRVTFHIQDNDNWYRVRFGQNGLLRLTVCKAGVTTNVAAFTLPHPFPLVIGVTVGVEVRIPEAGKRRVRVIVEGDTWIDYTFSEPNVFREGRLQIENDSGVSGDIYLDNVLLIAPPAHVDEIPGNGAMTSVPLLPAPKSNAIFNWTFTSTAGWTLTSLWHSSGFRHVSHPYALYFGTGEVGYHTWGTPGGYAGAIYNGQARSPTFDLTPWVAGRYKIWIEWRQYVDISLLYAQDDIQVGIRLLGGTVLTFYKADILAGGVGTPEHPRFDITQYVAGQNNVDFRFIFNTIVNHPSTGEGWYIDDVRISVTEV